jgi:hypothetical protein
MFYWKGRRIIIITTVPRVNIGLFLENISLRGLYDKLFYGSKYYEDMIKLNKLRQGSKGLSMTNILAYNTKESVTTI